MDFKRIFAEAERCHLEGKSASFNESFLNFASYAEGDQSIRASGWGPPPSGGGGKPSHEMANGNCCNRCAAGV